MNKQVPLHITNGDIAKQLIEKANDCEGNVIAWNDILYEGPVPIDVPIEQVSEIRARFLAGSGYDELINIQQTFVERDNALKNFEKHNEIVLWFEHDCYDQLQLLQILHWFSTEAKPLPPLFLICINQFDGIDPFFGLGQLNVSQINSLWKSKKQVSKQQLDSAATYWKLFCGKNPQALLESIDHVSAQLPFLKNAIIRFSEEFPAKENGLSKTEQYILGKIAAGLNDIDVLFSGFSTFEGDRYMGMGDTTFYKVINQLACCQRPLIRISQNKQLSLTETGDEVLSGKENHIDLNAVDCWRGGTHLTPNNLWLWNKKKGCLEQSTRT